jgi:hypothetical protein
MSRTLRPFLLFPRNGGAPRGGAPDDDLGAVVKDFRPATVSADPVVEVVPTQVEPDPKAPASQDSSAIESASDSLDDASKNETPDTVIPQGETTNQSSEPSEIPADAVKVKLLHPSATTTGSSEPPVQA